MRADGRSWLPQLPTPLGFNRYKALKILETDNWIQINRIGSAKVCCVRQNVFYTQQAQEAIEKQAQQIKNAVFRATVLASESEQVHGSIECQTTLEALPLILEHAMDAPPPFLNE